MSDTNNNLSAAERLRELETELAEANRRERELRRLLEDSQDIVYRTDLEGRISSISASVLAVSGYTVEEAVGMDMAREVYLIPEEREQFLAELNANGQVRDFVTRLKRKDGSYWWASTNAHLLRDRQGSVIGVEGIVRDITGAVEADLELHQIFTMSLDLICIADLKTATFTKVNPAFTTTLGYQAEELLGRSFMEFIHPEDIGTTRAVIEEKLLRGEKVLKFRNRYRCKDGSYRWLSWVSHPNPKTGMTYAIAHDITDEIAAAAALRESEKRFRAIIESSPMGIFLYELQADGRLILTGVNGATNRILGFDVGTLVGMTLEEAFPPLTDTEVPEAYRRVCRSGEYWHTEQIDYRDDRVASAFEVYAYQTSPGRAAVFFLDISERRRMEDDKRQLQEQLLQAQKMEAIGTLAGGIAHDFNNMLGGITGAAEMLALYLPDEEKARSFHRMILEAAARAGDLTTKLLAFSHSGPQSSSAVDMHQIINDTAVMLANTIDRRIRLELHLEAEAVSVIGDPSQLQNSLLNLCINAVQAMPEGGVLSIRTRVEEIDAGYCRGSVFDLRPGPCLELVIKDSGGGIAPEHLHRIFDPFFTTKEKGQGTGLGLASVYGTIQQHGGSIEVESEPGDGTEFRILLPLTRNGVAAQKSAKTRQHKGQGKILVVDDEDVMRVTATAILEHLGYQVEQAADGREALAIYDGAEPPFDLVLLDMIMPEMNGRDCFAALQQIKPDVRVIVSSGFTREEDLRDMKERGLCGFIRKPYTGDHLSRVVQRCLTRQGKAPC